MNRSDEILNIHFSWVELPDPKMRYSERQNTFIWVENIEKDFKCQVNFQQLFQLAKAIWKAICKQENKNM